MHSFQHILPKSTGCMSVGNFTRVCKNNRTFFALHSISSKKIRMQFQSGGETLNQPDGPNRKQVTFRTQVTVTQMRAENRQPRFHSKSSRREVFESALHGSNTNTGHKQKDLTNDARKTFSIFQTHVDFFAIRVENIPSWLFIRSYRERAVDSEMDQINLTISHQEEGLLRSGTSNTFNFSNTGQNFSR